MVQRSLVCLSIAAVLLVGIVITTTTSTTEIDVGKLVSIRSTLAQTTSTTNSGNMTTPMMESASFHLKAADRLLNDGNTKAALDQINLAEIQLSLLNMGSQETTANQSQAMEFVIGGSLSSMRMAANCIIENQGMVRCMQ